MIDQERRRVGTRLVASNESAKIKSQHNRFNQKYLLAIVTSVVNGYKRSTISVYYNLNLLILAFLLQAKLIRTRQKKVR